MVTVQRIPREAYALRAQPQRGWLASVVMRVFLTLLALAGGLSSEAAHAQVELISSRTIASAINSPSHLQQFTFTMPVAGMALLNVVTPAAHDVLQLSVQVFDSKGTRVAVSTTQPVFRWWRADLPAGKYTVHVRSAHSWYGAGPFQIQFIRGGAPTENGALVSALPVTKQLTMGDVDSYQFSATAGQTVIVSVTSRTGEMRPAMQIIDAKGKLVVSRSFLNRTSTEAVLIRQTGQHTVAVSSDWFTEPGMYDIELIQASKNSKHGELFPNEVRKGNLRVGSIDSYSIPVKSGDSLVISAVTAAGHRELSPRFRLIDPAGKLLGESFRTGQEARSAVRVTRNGFVTLAFDDQYQQGSGAYELRLIKAPGVARSGDMIQGGARLAYIVMGGIESFQATLAAGDVVDTGFNAEQFQPQLRVFGPDGALVAAAGNAQTKWVTRFTAPASGNYLFVVDAYYHEHSGSAQVTLKVNRDRLSYVAMGDSFSSGEGVMPYRDAKDNLTPLSGCHRSTRAYSTLVKLPNQAVPIAADRAWEFDFIACTGAVAANILSEPKEGEPAQLSPLNAVNAQRDLVTVTIGGNDAQFVGIIILCTVHADCGRIKPLERITGLTLEQLGNVWLEVVRVKAREAYTAIRSAASNATVVALGYPILLEGRECPAVTFPLESSLKITAAEQVWLRSYNQRLNEVLKEAAAAAGVHFVSVAERFAGRGICAKSVPWVNGFVPVPWNVAASFHPTATGQAEYAKLINDYFVAKSSGWPFGYHATGLPRNPAPAAMQPAFAAAPAAPRIASLGVQLPEPPSQCRNITGVAVAGERVVLTGTGFAPNESVAVSLVMNGQRVALGSASAGADGGLNSQVQLPAGTLTGRWGVVQAEGNGRDRAGALLLAPVKVVLSKTADLNANGVADICEP